MNHFFTGYSKPIGASNTPIHDTSQSLATLTQGFSTFNHPARWTIGSVSLVLPCLDQQSFDAELN
jgi:hypothetical protein